MPAILRTLFPDLDLSFHSKSSLIFRKSHSMATELHKRLEHQVSVTTNDVSWALCFYHSRVGTVKSAVRTDVRCGKDGDTEISPVDAASDGAEVGVAVGSAVRWSLGDNRMGHHSKVNLIIYNTHDILSWFLVVSRCPDSNYRDMLHFDFEERMDSDSQMQIIDHETTPVLLLPTSRLVSLVLVQIFPCCLPFFRQLPTSLPFHQVHRWHLSTYLHFATSINFPWLVTHSSLNNYTWTMDALTWTWLLSQSYSSTAPVNSAVCPVGVCVFDLQLHSLRIPRHASWSSKWLVQSSKQN